MFLISSTDLIFIFQHLDWCAYFQRWIAEPHVHRIISMYPFEVHNVFEVPTYQHINTTNCSYCYVLCIYATFLRNNAFVQVCLGQTARFFCGAVSECAFGPHAALAKKPEMLMYNIYTPLSELFAALPANQIHHSDPPPGKEDRLHASLNLFLGQSIDGDDIFLGKFLKSPERTETHGLLRHNFITVVGDVQAG